MPNLFETTDEDLEIKPASAPKTETKPASASASAPKTETKTEPKPASAPKTETAVIPHTAPEKIDTNKVRDTLRDIEMKIDKTLSGYTEIEIPEVKMSYKQMAIDSFYATLNDMKPHMPDSDQIATVVLTIAIAAATKLLLEEEGISTNDIATMGMQTMKWGFNLGLKTLQYTLGYKGGYVNYKNIWNSEFSRNDQYSSLCLSVDNLSHVIELIEEANNNNAKIKLTSYVSINNTMGEIENRKQLRVLNILDMNIVPFDVHSLMKEVPFANLINYSYTFDRLATELVLPDWFRYKSGSRKNDIIKVTDFTGDGKMNNNEALLLSIIYPHHSYEMEFIIKLHSFINGNERVGKFGKPAYISDQLFSKVLLDLDGGDTENEEKILATIVTRFNTKLFRNLLWFAQLQRLMKASMISYLSHVESPVVTGLDIADPIITEYTREGQTYDERVFQGIRDNLL